MKTTLKEYRDHLAIDNMHIFAVRVIDDFIHNVFLELTSSFEWELDSDPDFDEILIDCHERGECHTQSEFEETLQFDEGIDICVKTKFNVDASVHCEMDGGIFLENKSFDVFEIIFYTFGQEWDLSNDKDAIKFVNKVLNTYI